MYPRAYKSENVAELHDFDISPAALPASSVSKICVSKVLSVLNVAHISQECCLVFHPYFTFAAAVKVFVKDEILVDSCSDFDLDKTEKQDVSR